MGIIDGIPTLRRVLEYDDGLGMPQPQKVPTAYQSTHIISIRKPVAKGLTVKAIYGRLSLGGWVGLDLILNFTSRVPRSLRCWISMVNQRFNSACLLVFSTAWCTWQIATTVMVRAIACKCRTWGEGFNLEPCILRRGSK